MKTGSARCRRACMKHEWPAPCRNSRYRAERYGYALLAKGGYALLRRFRTLCAQKVHLPRIGLHHIYLAAVFTYVQKFGIVLVLLHGVQYCVVHGLCRNGAYSCRGKGGHCAAHVCAEPCEQGTYQYRGRAYADEQAP